MTGVQTWRSRVGWLAGQLFVVFLGVSAAFLVENYRQRENDKAEMMQAVAGIIKELEEYEIKSVKHADAFDSAIEKWKTADRPGARAVPGYYRIPGSSHPPNGGLDDNC